MDIIVHFTQLVVAVARLGFGKAKYYKVLTTIGFPLKHSKIYSKMVQTGVAITAAMILQHK